MKVKQRSSRSWRLPLVALLIVVFGLVLVATPAWAATTTNIMDIPVNGTAFNTCTGGIVTISGVEHLTARVTLDGNGGVLLGSHSNIHTTATDNLGNTYVGNQEENSQQIVHVGLVVTTTFAFEEISTGSAPNLVIHGLFHITVNPDGTITASVDKGFTATCRG